MSITNILFLICFIGTFSAFEASPIPSEKPNPRTVNAITLPDSSLYQIQSDWENDAGAKIRLESLQGKIRILSLFFGHCESSCPMVLSTLKSIESSLPKNWNKNGGIVLITLDPERDSAESLVAFRKRMSMSPESWTLLRGKEADTRELAMALGVTYRRSKSNGGMDHDAVIVILDKQGRIVKRHEGRVEVKTLIEEYHSVLKSTLP